MYQEDTQSIRSPRKRDGMRSVSPKKRTESDGRKSPKKEPSGRVRKESIRARAGG